MTLSATSKRGYRLVCYSSVVRALVAQLNCRFLSSSLLHVSLMQFSLAPNVCNFVIPQAHGEGSEGTMCKVSTVSDKVLEITISNSERHTKTPSGEADSRGGGGEGGGGEKEREGGGGGGGGREGGERDRREEGEGEEGEGEEGGGGGGEGEEGGGEGGEEKGRGERGGGGGCEEALPEEAKVVEQSKEQTKRTMRDEQGLNCSTGGREGGEQEVTRGEGGGGRGGRGGGGGTGHKGDAGTAHEGDAGSKTKGAVQLSNKLMFALD